MKSRTPLFIALGVLALGCSGQSDAPSRGTTASAESRDTARSATAADAGPVRMTCQQFADGIRRSQLPSQVTLDVEYVYRDTFPPTYNVDLSTGAQSVGDMGAVRDFYRCAGTVADDSSVFLIEAFVRNYPHGERPPSVPPAPRGIRTMTAILSGSSSYYLRPLRKGDTTRLVPAIETNSAPTFR